jgi:hypothetical protein
MAVDVALWTVLAAMAGFIALGCMVTRKTKTGGHAPMPRQYGGGHN